MLFLGGGWNIFKRLPYGMAPSKFRPAIESLYGGQSISSTQLTISVLEPGMIQPTKTRMQDVRLDNNTNIYCIKMK